MKKLIMVIIFITIKAVSFAQEEASYYANKDDILYKYYYSDSSERNGEVYKGEPIISIEGELNIVSSADKKTKRVEVQTKNNKGWLYTNSISIIDSEILPDEITKNVWTNSYYLDVMKKGNREVLFTYEPFWRDGFYKYENYFGIQSITSKWYEIAYIPPFEFGNIYADLRFFVNNTYTFIFEKISKGNGVFSFSATCTYKHIIIDEADVGKSFPLNKKVNMMLVLDGDYLDVYINNEKTFSLIKLTNEIKKQFENLLEYDRCDLSNITFPRRAAKQLNVGEECRILENLRLRETPGATGAVIKTLEQGSKVTILEIGQKENIDGATAPWVKVKTSDGETGWCFGLYLQETRFDPTPEEMAVKVKSKTEDTDDSNDDKNKATSLPLWALLVIIGGAVAVVGGGVLFVLKRKK